MSQKNRFLTQQVAAIQSPFAFTSTAGSASAADALTTTRANVDLIIEELSYEGTDGDHPRFYFDEMSNPARLCLLKAMLDLKAASAA